jgi:transcriptional regulator with XRE-family HTH domain
MQPKELKSARLERGWSQQEAAARLGLSQPYFAMLETGKRRLSPQLVRKARKLFRLPPTVLPPSGFGLAGDANQALAEQLSALGYEGFAYLRPRRWQRNPAEVLLTGLAQENLEARLVEALPWLLVRYWNMDRAWLVREAKLRDLQNRLGFVVSLAHRVAQGTDPQNRQRLQALAELEQTLEQSKLEREDTLCKASMTEAERRWLSENRPDEASRWHLLTDWRAETLPYAA